MEIQKHVQQSCTERLEALPMRSLVRYDQTLCNEQACLRRDRITRPLLGSVHGVKVGLNDCSLQSVLHVESRITV